MTYRILYLFFTAFLHQLFFEPFRKFFIRSHSVVFCPCSSPDAAVFPEDFKLKVLDRLADTIACSCAFADNAEFLTKNWRSSFIFNHFLTPDISYIHILYFLEIYLFQGTTCLTCSLCRENISINLFFHKSIQQFLYHRSFFPASGPGAHWNTSLIMTSIRVFAGRPGFAAFTIAFILSNFSPELMIVAFHFIWKHPPVSGPHTQIATFGFSSRFARDLTMKLSAIQIVSSSTSWQKPMGTTLGTPSFEAVATGKIFTFEKAVFISSVNFTIIFHHQNDLQYKFIYLSVRILYLKDYLCTLITFQG